MLTAEESKTGRRISLADDIDSSLRELSDEELEQIAGGEWTITFTNCGCVVKIGGDGVDSWLDAADQATLLHSQFTGH